MKIALFGSDQPALSAIADALRREGISVSPFVLSAKLSRDRIGAPVTNCVLVANEAALIDMGEQVERVRELVGDDPPLILCGPRPAASDRKVLEECGASEIITPRSWNAEHVGERILGQVILGGGVTPNGCGAFCGATLKVRELYSHIERLAPLSEPILILGETGTGKELVARELHSRSGRRDSYVPINCPEINSDLISSELFGHEKGAFTGADKSRVGLIASAGRGTVFLDEIGDLDLQSQAKLLRVLEERKVRRVGANHYEDVYARIILATNCDLRESCNEGKFRRDLYERISGFTLEIPPLRGRKADIPILARHFVDEYNNEYKTDCKIPTDGVDCLFGYDWPGNVRELRAVIRKAAAYSDASGFISSPILQESVRRPQVREARNVVAFDPAVDSWRVLLNRAQTTYFRALLTHTNGKREAAIKISGLSKSQFFEKLKELPNEE